MASASKAYQWHRHGIMAGSYSERRKNSSIGIGVMANENGGEKAAWRHQAASAASSEENNGNNHRQQ
jgi:hypothetical protein